MMTTIVESKRTRFEKAIPSLCHANLSDDTSLDVVQNMILSVINMTYRIDIPYSCSRTGELTNFGDLDRERDMDNYETYGVLIYRRTHGADQLIVEDLPDTQAALTYLLERLKLTNYFYGKGIRTV